jgi:hypothetical protein
MSPDAENVRLLRKTGSDWHTAKAALLTPSRTLRAPRQELWYPPSNAMGRFNEAADPQMALAARAERPRVLRLHTDLKIALPDLKEDQRREAGQLELVADLAQ